MLASFALRLERSARGEAEFILDGGVLFLGVRPLGVGGQLDGDLGSSMVLSSARAAAVFSVCAARGYSDATVGAPYRLLQQSTPELIVARYRRSMTARMRSW